MLPLLCRHRVSITALAVGLALATPPVSAAAPHGRLLAELPALSDAELAAHHGRFLSADGVLIRFGIASSTAIDGQTVAALSLSGGVLGRHGLTAEAVTVQAITGLAPAGSGVFLLGGPGGLTHLVQNHRDGALIEHTLRVNLDLFNIQAILRPWSAPIPDLPSVLR